MQNRQETCRARVKPHLRGRLQDIRKLWRLYQNDPEANNDELGNFNEYGLCFDYVAPNTFEQQRRGYFRYQLSWGGPSDEFRFYADENLNPSRIEYWFMDWFDGAKIILHGKDYDLLEEIFQGFKDCGTVEYAREQAS